MGRLLESLKLGHADGTYLTLLSHLQKVDMLILDDWGWKDSKANRSVICWMISKIVMSAAVLLSSVNRPLPIAQWHELMDNPTVADALLDHLIHNAHRLELKGESQRKKTLVEGDDIA